MVFLSGSESMQVFLSYIYICVAIGDPVIKTGRLGSSHQDGKVGIQLSRQEGWDPVIKCERCLFVYRVRGVDLFIVRGDCLFIE